DGIRDLIVTGVQTCALPILYIKQVAAALGYIGLVNYNRVTVAAMADGIVAETGAMRGRRRVGQMIDFVNKLQPTGASHLAEACQIGRASCRERVKVAVGGGT